MRGINRKKDYTENLPEFIEEYLNICYRTNPNSEPESHPSWEQDLDASDYFKDIIRKLSLYFGSLSDFYSYDFRAFSEVNIPTAIRKDFEMFKEELCYFTNKSSSHLVGIGGEHFSFEIFMDWVFDAIGEFRPKS